MHKNGFVVDFDAIILGGAFLAENEGSLSLSRMRSRQIQSRYEHTMPRSQSQEIIHPRRIGF